MERNRLLVLLEPLLPDVTLLLLIFAPAERGTLLLPPAPVLLSDFWNPPSTTLVPLPPAPKYSLRDSGRSLLLLSPFFVEEGGDGSAVVLLLLLPPSPESVRIIVLSAGGLVVTLSCCLLKGTPLDEAVSLLNFF